MNHLFIQGYFLFNQCQNLFICVRFLSYIAHKLFSNVFNTIMNTFLWKVEIKLTSKHMNIQKVLFLFFCFSPKDIPLYLPTGMPFVFLLPTVYFQIAPFELWANQFLLAGFISPDSRHPRLEAKTAVLSLQLRRQIGVFSEGFILASTRCPRQVG